MKDTENTRRPGGSAPERTETRAHGPEHATRRAIDPPGAPMGEVPQYSYAWVQYVLGALLALLLAVAVFKLQYSYGQAPHRVIKIFGGLLLFLFVFFRPWMALHAWLLAIPMGEWLPATGIPGINAASLLLLTLVFSWIAPRVMRGERVYRHSRLALPMAAYMAILFMSIGHAALFPLDGVSRSFLDVLRLAWGVTLVMPIYYVVVSTVEDKKQVRSLLLTFAAGCALAGLFAAFEFARAPSNSRIAGTLGDINDLGAYFAMCAAMLVALMMNSGVYPYVKRAVVWLSAVLAMVAVALP